MSTRSATHYELIGLEREASADEIKAAFRTQAQIHHPDAGGDTESFAALSAAHDVLSDPVRRSDYDATLPAAGSARFSGWSRPATESDLPRRRPTVDDAGDDPMVFRRRADVSPTLRHETMAPEERGDTGLGTVEGGDFGTVDTSRPAEPPVAAATDLTPEASVPDELDRPEPKEGRWTFFGRRAGADEVPATPDPVDPEPPARSVDEPRDEDRPRFPRRTEPEQPERAYEGRGRDADRGGRDAAERPYEGGVKKSESGALWGTDERAYEGGVKKSGAPMWGTDEKAYEGGARKSGTPMWGTDEKAYEGRAKKSGTPLWGTDERPYEGRGRGDR